MGCAVGCARGGKKYKALGDQAPIDSKGQTARVQDHTEASPGDTIVEPFVQSESESWVRIPSHQSHETTSSTGSGPAPKSPSEALHEGLSTPGDVYAQGGYDLCVLSGPGAQAKPGKPLAEKDFDEKQLECAMYSTPTQHPSVICGPALDARLALEGAGIVCRKGRSLEVPNQDSVLFLRSGPLICCGLVDGFGTCGQWAANWVAQCTTSLLLSEVCLGKPLSGEPTVNSKMSISLPTDRTVGRIYNIVHDALVLRASEVGQDIRESGASLSLCMVDCQTREVLISWIGDAHCLIGQDDGTVEQNLTQVLSYNSGELVFDGQSSWTTMSSLKSLRGYTEETKKNLAKDLFQNPASNRRLGSQCLHEHGGSHTGLVRRYTLQEPPEGVSQFLLCATNGIWDALDGPEVASATVASTCRENPDRAVQNLCQKAKENWNADEDDEETDDMSVILVWL